MAVIKGFLLDPLAATSQQETQNMYLVSNIRWQKTNLMLIMLSFFFRICSKFQIEIYLSLLIIAMQKK